MIKRYMGGLMVLVLGLALMAYHIIDFYTLYRKYGVQEGLVIVHSLPILVALMMLLRCKRSAVMADASAAIAGCLYGVCLGSVYPAFVAMLWFGDGTADGRGVIFFVAALLLTVLVCVMDCLRNKKKLSARRFLLETCIALSLIGPMFAPAYRAISACMVRMC